MLACNTCPMGVAALLGLLTAGLAVAAACVAAALHARRKRREKRTGDGV